MKCLALYLIHWYILEIAFGPSSGQDFYAFYEAEKMEERRGGGQW
jgi:hypothetical protein